MFKVKHVQSSSAADDVKVPSGLLILQMNEMNTQHSRILTHNRIAAVVLMVLQLVIIVFYGLFIRYEQVYPNLEDLQVAVGLALLLLVGFGLVISYIKDAGLSGMGFALLITSIVFQLFFLVNAFWTKAAIQVSTSTFSDPDRTYKGLVLGQNSVDTPVNIPPFSVLTQSPKATRDQTVWAAFKCCLSMIVSFSALLGRAGPLEIAIMIPIGTAVYELNSQLMSRYSYDPGSSMRVFVFGAFFGFVASWAMRNPRNAVHASYVKYTSSKFNATLALIGSIFCFVLFPTLTQQRNFTNAETPIYNFMKFACTINSILSMTGSILTATLVSLFFDLKLGIKDFIFSSIAGGIAIGASTDLITNPGAAILVGCIAGLTQVIYNRILEKFVNQASIVDSLGCLGLFGLSGIWGGIWASIFSAFQNNPDTKSIFLANAAGSPSNFSLYVQSGGAQIGALFMTMAIASIAGGIVGWILLMVNRNTPSLQFSDFTYWTTDDDGISFRDTSAFNVTSSSNLSAVTGQFASGVINMPRPAVVMPVSYMSPMVRPGGEIIGPCSYL